jgi:hypothetical protein
VEIWKPIKEFEGLYEVSNKGNIRSIRGEKPILLSKHLINTGYEVVTFSVNGKKYKRLVHRLVAEAFCGGYKEGFDVNHKDANRTNNCAENLEWVTRKENIHDCMRRGSHSIKEAHAVAHEKRKRPVAQLDDSGNIIRMFESAREAAKHVGVHENCVSRVCRGEREKTAGFRFVYLDSR